MKIKLRCLVSVLALVSGVHHATAQGTMFTYQGRLNSGGSPANGNYDFQFILFNVAQFGFPVGPILTNSALSVTDGLFTAALDFGAGIFTGSNLWLDISVRTNGNGSFTELLPRQPLLATPYAVFANMASNLSGSLSASQIAGSLPATQITGALPSTQISGTLALSQLPSALVTNGESGLTLSGSFAGNAGGLSNVYVVGAQGTTVWQVPPGTAVQALSNMGYLLTNSQQVTVTLPASPIVGDVVQVFGSGNGGWMIAQNPSQSILYNSAPPWVQTSAPITNWYSIASSSDGSKLAAVQYEGGIYTSINFGKNWTLQPGAPSAYWNSIASSSDGSKLAAMMGNGGIYTSSNCGTNWTLQGNAPSAYWTSIACSSDGSKLAAAAGGGTGGGIYTSTNFGNNWSLQPSAPNARWYSIASSSDGSKLAAVVIAVGNSGGGIYTSTNFGTNWSVQPAAPITSWTCIASSSDGSKLVAVAGSATGGNIYTSSNFGTNWSLTMMPQASWTCIASSSDGSKLAAAVGGIAGESTDVGGVYTSSNFGTNWKLARASYFGWQSTYWQSIASSSDGSRLAGVANGGGIWTYNSPAVTTTGITGLLDGGPGAGVMLVYAGSGQFVVVSEQGGVYGQ